MSLDQPRAGRRSLGSRTALDVIRSTCSTVCRPPSLSPELRLVGGKIISKQRASTNPPKAPKRAPIESRRVLLGKAAENGREAACAICAIDRLSLERQL